MEATLTLPGGLSLSATAHTGATLSLTAAKDGVQIAAATVPAGWAADHDAASFQQVTHQRADPVPSCGGRSVTNMSAAALSGDFVIGLSPSTTRITCPAATTTWATEAVSCRVPGAAVLASLLACATDEVGRSHLATALHQVQTAAGRAGSPPTASVTREECLAKGYSTFHAELFAQAAAGAGSGSSTLSNAAFAGLQALGRGAGSTAAPALSAADTAAIPVAKLGSYAIPSSGAETMCSRGDVLGALSRDGFVVLHDAALRDGAVIEGGDDAAALPLGSSYAARASPAACPTELLASRVTAMTALAASTFGVVRNTHYGSVSTWGDAAIGAGGDAADPSKADPVHLDTAYVRVGIGLHTDSTYFAEPPGIQIFGCVHRCPEASSGGASELTDGFAAAWDLFGEDRALFKALVDTPVPATYVKEGRAFTAHRPVLAVGPAATSSSTVTPEHVRQVSFNAYDRAPLPACISPAEQERFYVGYTRFAQLCAARARSFQLEVGDVLFFNNLRMLHARTAYTGPRIMAGAYVGVDDVSSAIVSEALMNPGSRRP